MRNALRTVLQKPGWVLPYNPDLQIDFKRGRAWLGTGTGGGAVVPQSNPLSPTRASVAMADDLRGQWREFPANTIAGSDAGALIWDARTNLALWCRDWTNAAWVKVTMTTALTATGIDGTANAATTLTATGASSTALQTVTHASSADTVSIFVRRRTGTGTIEVTADGVAYTDITAALATAATATPGGWYRAVVSATLVNPVFGVRITTSGDAVDVDFAQLEVGTSVGSPITTTTVSVTQAADVIAVAIAPGVNGIPFPMGMVYTISFAFTPFTPTAFGTIQNMGSIRNANVDNITPRRNASTGAAQIVVRANNTATTVSLAETLSQNTAYGFAVGTDNAGTAYASINGAAVETGAYAGVATAPPINMNLGTATGASQLDGRLTTFALWATRLLPAGVMQTVSAVP